MNRLAQFIVANNLEGLSLKAYADVGGIWTIGYGHTGPEVHEGLVWTTEQTDDALDKDTFSALTFATGASPDIVGNKLTAIADFCYNVGNHGYYISTLRKLVNSQADDPAIEAEFRKWVHSGGALIKGLVNRREAEIKLWNTPDAQA